MHITPTHIAEVKLIQPKLWHDERGLFTETFSLARYRQALALPELHFVQTNLSHSQHNVLRGLHFQHQHPQGKLIQCLHGEIYDVAVDVRRHSATFGQWVAHTLSAQTLTQLWIPPGFAHGFVVLSASASVYYQCTDYYHPQSETTLLWNDASIGIDWPLSKPILSAKDAQGQTLDQLVCLP